MSFSGRVKSASHEGGLLVSFEGRAPRLGANIRILGGKILGKVNTVLGPVGEPLVHVHPLMEGIDANAALGSPVEIAPRVRASQGRNRKRTGGKRDYKRNYPKNSPRKRSGNSKVGGRKGSRFPVKRGSGQRPPNNRGSKGRGRSRSKR